MRWLFAALLLLGLADSAAAQVPSTQCVTTALAGGSADAITTPRLPCVPTTTLLILKLTATNTTTTPTIQPVGAPAQVVRRSNNTALAAGDLPQNATVMLTNNGTNWLLLTGGGAGGGGVGPPGPPGPPGGTGPPGPPGPPGGTGGATAWTVLNPSSGGDDTAAINAALVSSSGVILGGGIFTITGPITIPRYKVLSGTGVGMYYSGTAGTTPDPWQSNSTLWCKGGSGFNTSDLSVPQAACVFMHDQTTLENLAVSGPNVQTGGTGTNNIACVSATSSQGVTVRNSVLANCQTGVRLFSDGNHQGDQGTLTQEFNITGNTIWWVVDGIDIETLNGGQGTTDWRVSHNEIEVPDYAGIRTQTTGTCLGFQIQSNRIEDGNIGIQQSCNQGTISNNIMNNLSAPMTFDNQSYGLIVLGNSMANSATASASPCFDILGQISGSTFNANHCLYGYGGVYKMEAGATAQNLLINDLPLAIQGGPPFFSGDTTLTDPTLRPFTMPFLFGTTTPSPWTP